MGQIFFIKKIYIFPLLFMALLFSQLYLKPQLPSLTMKYISPPAMKHFTFGYAESMADFLWIRAVQDFDHCSEKKSSQECEGKSWLFRMLDQATDLAPKFRIVYAAGALALTVIISDYEGASLLFDKGVKNLPNDWTISYRAAYHALYEEKNKIKAAELLKKSGDHGAPVWVYSLAGRLYSEDGEKDMALALLAELRAKGEDPTIIRRLEEKLGILQK